MSSSNNQPDALQMPFANNGDKSTIPSSATGTNKASLAEGFPQITSESIADGGIPPSREDFNALGNISTSHNYFMQNGGGYTFVPAVSTAIGGYPKGALLWYRPSTGNPQLLVSTKNNNTDNFNTNQSYIGTEGSGKSWEIVTVSGSNYVDRSTNQTIGGSKTFSSGIKTTAAGFGFSAVMSGLTKGTAPSTNTLTLLSLLDKNGTSTWANTLGRVSLQYSTNGDVVSSLTAFKPELNSTVSSSIRITYPASGNPYTEAPTPDTSDNSTKIATTAYVQAQGYALDSAVVKTTGNQDVDGIKKFTEKLVRKNSQQNAFSSISAQATAITKGTSPTTNTEARWYMTDSSGDFGNACSIAGMVTGYNTNGTTSAILSAYKPEASSTVNSRLGIYYPSTGNAYTEAPTPDSSDNSTKIATTAFVKSVLSSSGNGLATYSKAKNGYYKFANGLIIQWGITTSVDNETTITLPTAFTSTNYVISCTTITNSAAYQRTLKDSSSRTTTAFTTYMSGVGGNSNFTWLAIGY